MDLSPGFWICVAIWIALPAVALLVRTELVSEGVRKPCKRTTKVIHWLFYIAILALIVACYAYNAVTGKESPLLSLAWIIAGCAPFVAVYIFMDDQLAFP